MAVAAAVTLLLTRFTFAGNEAVIFAKTALITVAITSVAWVAATFLTPPEREEKLTAFYRRVHPTVYGWRPIARLAPELPAVRDVGSNAFDALMGCVLVYGCLFGIGKLVFGAWGTGLFLLGLAGIAGYMIFWDLSRRGWSALTGAENSGANVGVLAATKAD